MRTAALTLLLVLLALSTVAQEKPRVFVQGKGSENIATSGSAAGGRHWAAWGSHSNLDAHDESMEVTKDLQKNCSQVTVTLNQSNADYTIMLNRESKHNRGLLRTNSQVQVANKEGDVIGTNATRTVGNAAKDACILIAADWHGRINAPTPGVSVTPSRATAKAAPSATPQQPDSDQPRVETKAHLVETVAQSTSSDEPKVAAISTVTGSTVSNASDGIAEAARRAKQHKACLELAKDNPSITCK